MNDGMSALSNSNSIEDEDDYDHRSTSPKSRSPTESVGKRDLEMNYVADPMFASYHHETNDEAAEEQPKAVENLFSDLSCCCLPTCASTPSSILSRTWLWFLANSDQFMSSIIVAINLIPEAISYGVMAGLGPRAALQSCWIGNMATSLVGGRPGMVSGASGLMALVLSRLVQTGVDDDEGGVISGIAFVPYAIGFAGILESFSSLFGMGRLASSFPAPVVVGMVNAVALLTLALQFRYAKEYTWDDQSMSEKASSSDSAVNFEWVIALLQYFGKGIDWITPYVHLGTYGAEVVLSLIICTFLPRVTTVFPATLVSILTVAAVEFCIARQLGVKTPLIGDYGGAQVQNPIESVFSSELYSSKLPSLSSLENWKIISGYGCALFATTFTETAIALNVVDRLDETQGPGALVLIGQGFSNIVSAVMGGMGGSGVISSSVLADRTFGTTCLSTFFTGLVVFVCVTWAYPVINYIPLSAISGISISMVCSYIQWRSIVAIFTTCLPNPKRDGLPPQYNVARYDVFFMVFVTTACLLLDVATLAIFVIGLVVFLFHAVRSRCCGKDRNTNHDASSEKKFFEWRGKKNNHHQTRTKSKMNNSHASVRGGEENDFPQYDEGIEVTRSGTIGTPLEAPSVVTSVNSIMEAAEHIIFPVETESVN
eukprot:CCRYP_000411-RA/>CCRYP_000411-RA protein AED:0.06 eAED:0.06 QI:216/1/1/1/1/1/4/130/655